MKKLLLITLSVFLSFGPAFAGNLPDILGYKKRIISGLNASYVHIDTTYNARFVTMTQSQDLTINKTPVYYDSIKALFEFNELTNDRTGLTTDEIAILDRIPEYIYKSKRIIAQRYIQSPYGGGGYQAFPHGLSYLYQSTGDPEAYAGLVDLRNEGNWVTGFSDARESIVYSREVAYTIQVAIMAERLGIPASTTMSHTELMGNYLRLALSQLNQWHTGIFYGDTSKTAYRSTFMTGLTMHALIEYYERVNPDPRIPPAIKNILDDIWATVWHPDVTNPPPSDLGDSADYQTMNPGGAFWTWANWDSVTKQYVIDRNHNPNSQDVSATHNLIIGPSYAWYATISHDAGYMDKAIDIFNGTVANLSTYNPSGQLWEGMRYDVDLIKWYNKFFQAPCSKTALDQCVTQTTCESATGNWTGEWCQHAPVEILSTMENCADSSALCFNQTECEAASWNWCNDNCQQFSCNTSLIILNISSR